MSENTIVFNGNWPEFAAKIPPQQESKCVRLELKTGSGKTLFYPVYGCASAKPQMKKQSRPSLRVVIVPKRVHVENCMNFHLNNARSKDCHARKANVLIHGIFHQYNKYIVQPAQAARTLKPILTASPPPGKFDGEVMYITAGSFLRKLLTGKLSLTRIDYLMLDEIHVVENDYCILVQTLNQIAAEIRNPGSLPQIILSSATLNASAIERLSPLLNTIGYENNSVSIVNEKTPYAIQTKFVNMGAVTHAQQNSENNAPANAPPSIIYMDKILDFMKNETIRAVETWFRQGSRDIYMIDNMRIQPGILLHLPGKNECHEVGNAVFKELSGVYKSGIQIVYIYSGSEDSMNFRAEDDKEQRIFYIIIATNADSGITLPIGITIDSALKKHVECTDNAEGNEVWSLLPMYESKSGMIQRRGRVGRTGDGICYHCISEEAFRAASEHTHPDTFKGENNELVLAVIDAGFYFDKKLYNDLPATIKNLERLELVKEGSADAILNQTSIISDKTERFTTETGSAVVKLPLPVIWAKLITISPFRLKHASTVIATFYAIQKNGGFFRGKTSPSDFLKRCKLMGKSQLTFIWKLWEIAVAAHDNGRINPEYYKRMKEAGKTYAIEYKSLIAWINNVIDICDRINIHKDFSVMELNQDLAQRCVSAFLLFNGTILGSLETRIATVYSDGCVDLAYKVGGSSIAACEPNSNIISTDQIMHYKTTTGAEVFTSQVWFTVDDDIIEAIKRGNIEDLEPDLFRLLAELIYSNLEDVFQFMASYDGGDDSGNEILNIRSSQFARLQNRINGLFAKLRDRMVNAAAQSAMIDVLNLLEQELFDKIPKTITIGDVGSFVEMTVNKRNKIMRKYYSAKDPFFGTVCDICENNSAEDCQLVVLTCNHVYHAECYKSFTDNMKNAISGTKNKNINIACSVCKEDRGAGTSTVICIVNRGLRALPQRQKCMKGRVIVVSDDGLGHIPQYIREEMEAEKARKAEVKKITAAKVTTTKDNGAAKTKPSADEKELERRRKEFDERQRQMKLAAKTAPKSGGGSKNKSNSGSNGKKKRR